MWVRLSVEQWGDELVAIHHSLLCIARGSSQSQFLFIMFFLELVLLLYALFLKACLSFYEFGFLDLCLLCLFLFPQALGDGLAPLLDLLILEALLALLAHGCDR